MPNDDCQEIIRRALSGDQRAYDELMKRYKGGIYTMIFQMVRNREETEDLMQETFMKAFRALGTFNRNYAFSTWLYKIALNNCIDAIRRKKLKTTPLDRPIACKEGEIRQEIRDDSCSPEKEFLFTERNRLVMECVNALPDIYRDVIILRHQEERSYEEIGDMLHLPVGTVKARIFRAREILKKKLRET